MKVIVWKVGDWRPGKFPDRKTNETFDVKRVMFKSLDEKDKETYYLNLDKKQPDVVEKWEPHIKEGNVLDVVLVPKGVGYVDNATTINKFESFTVIKTVEN